MYNMSLVVGREGVEVADKACQTCTHVMKHVSFDMKHVSFDMKHVSFDVSFLPNFSYALTVALTSGFMSKETCFMSKETYFMLKETRFMSKETCFMPKETCFMSKETCFMSKETYFMFWRPEFVPGAWTEIASRSERYCHFI